MKLFQKKWLWFTIVAYLAMGASSVVYSAATFLKTDNTTSVTFTNFGEIISGKLINGFSIAATTANNNPWDLFVENGVTITQMVAYDVLQPGSIQLPLSSINIRAVNACGTADQDYGLGIRAIPAITSNLNPSFSVPGPHYIVGSALLGEGVLTDNNGACSGLVEINDDGTPVNNPATNTFRFDIQVTPGVGSLIQPGMYRLDLSISIADDATGIVSKTDIYSLVIDIQPIISMKMSTPSQIDFNFTEIKNYTAGVTNYGATKLTINSSVNWDLMVIGTSTRNEGSLGGSPYWDNAASYSSVGTLDIPLDALEIFQSPGNPAAGQSGVGFDYSPPFTTPPSGNNNIEIAYGAGAAITGVGFYAPLAKTIAGNWGSSGAGNMMTPGSDLVVNPAWNKANFSYVISYRLVPGLPVIFSHTHLGAMPTYARPGSYTMQVKYILVEDQ